MADLTDIQAAQSVKLVGSGSTGAESTPVKSSSNGDLGVVDISDNGGIEGTLTVGTTAVELKVGGNALANRKFTTFFNSSNTTIHWGHTNAVTTSTGTPIFKDQERGWSVGPGTSIWLIAGSADNVCRITERA